MERQDSINAAAGLSWSAWFISHIAEINAVLQTVVLVLGIISTAWALVSHYRREHRR